MSKRALEETNYEDIKGHIVDPANSPLSEQKQEQLDRIMSVIRLMDKNPIKHTVFMMHQKKYSHLKKYQVYEDVKMAQRLYNTVYEFDWGFWRSWMINDIVDNIITCRKSKSDIGRRIIAMEHSNLIKIIGTQPENLENLNREEKTQYYILIQNNHQELKIDMDHLENIPETTMKQINKLIYGGDEISETDAEQIMKT